MSANAIRSTANGAHTSRHFAVRNRRYMNGKQAFARLAQHSMKFLRTTLIIRMSIPPGLALTEGPDSGGRHGQLFF